MDTTRSKFSDSLYIILTIASKDILDAIKNRMVVSQIIVVTFILLTVKGLSWVIQPPYTQIMVFDPGNSYLTQVLEDSPDFDVQHAASVEELQQVIGNMGFGLGAELGIAIPDDFDLILDSGDQSEISGYISWANRTKAPALKSEMESALQELTGRSVIVDIEGNIISPPPEIGLLGGLITVFAVTIILLMGIILVPNLVLEEKETRTMEALLISPASISQVVVGKALAGFFYILVTSAIVYIIYWTGVVHWGLTLLFVLASGLFSVALGLTFGMIFNSQQEMTGWLSLTLIVITGSIFIVLIGLDMPDLIETLIKFIPSVALAKIFWASFSTQAEINQVWMNMTIVVVFSVILYGFIIWKVRQLDR
jgi:ABC-2 type transport system permease protein